MMQPITLIQVGQMMVEDYGLDADGAVQAAITLVKRLERRGMQVIKGDWLVPEVVTVTVERPARPTPTEAPRDRWMDLASKITKETMEREPWRTQAP